MDLLNFVKEIANWTGWAPIALTAIGLIPVGIFFYTRELANKDVTIQRSNQDLENSKQYQVDVLVQNLSLRTRVLTEELERLNGEVVTENRKSSQIEQEKAKIQEQLDLAQADAVALKQRLGLLEQQLDNLLGESGELDICRVCTVDEDRVMMNTIYWGGKSGKLIGDTDLVEEGVCSYCASINLKCKVCRGITGIDANATDVIECEGCYDTLYTPSSFFGKKLDDTIKVSRRLSE